MSTKIIDSTPNDIHEIDCIKRMSEGLAIAISGCVEMHEKEPAMGWDKVAEGLRTQRMMNIKLARKKALTRQALLDHAAMIQSKLGQPIHY